LTAVVARRGVALHLAAAVVGARLLDRLLLDALLLAARLLGTAAIARLRLALGAPALSAATVAAAVASAGIRSRRVALAPSTPITPVMPALSIGEGRRGHECRQDRRGDESSFTHAFSLSRISAISDRGILPEICGANSGDWAVVLD
jgi:hypothetical protein